MRFLRALGFMVMALFIATALVFASPPAMASGKSMKAIYYVNVSVPVPAAPATIDTSPLGGVGTRSLMYAVDRRGSHLALKEAPERAPGVV